MSTIDPEILDCALFLYKSAEDARKGVRSGGTGFLVILPFAGPEPTHGTIFAVTCSHVIRRGEAPVVRLNNRDNAIAVFPLGLDRWIHHDVADVAVAPIDLSLKDHRFKVVAPWHFVKAGDRAWFSEGTDALMVGRFVNHEGKQQNLPTARFGNVALRPNPNELVAMGDGLDQEAFLVEVHSLGGYSGSPVFVYFQYPSDSPSKAVEEGKVPRFGNADMRFLGIDCAHLPDRAAIRGPDGKATGDYVNLNTGMAAVVPAWKLAELLEYEDVVKIRERDEKESAER